MTSQDAFQFARLAVVGFVLYRLTVRGYRKRRPTWSPDAWRRFGVLVGASLATIAVGWAMAWSVDLRIYDRYGFSPGARSAYAGGLVTLSILGTLGAVGALLWFANGRADGEIRWPRWARRQRAAR